MTSRLRVADWRLTSSCTRSAIPSSCASGVIPSCEVSLRGAISCSCRPATRTWKKSSRPSLTMARKRILSVRGRTQSSAIASTRLSKSSRESSRLKNLSLGRARVFVADRTLDFTATGLLLWRQRWIRKPPDGQRQRRPAQPKHQSAQYVAGPVLAHVDASDAHDREQQCGHEPEDGHGGPGQASHGQAHDEEDQEPAEERDVAARVAGASGVPDHVDKIRRRPGPLDDHRRDRVDRTAQCAGHHQRRSPPVDGHHEHDAGHAYDLLSRAFDLVEEFEDGDERAPVDGLDESFDWDVKRKVLLAGGRQCVDCEDGHAGEAEDKKGQGEWGHLRLGRIDDATDRAQAALPLNLTQRSQGKAGSPRATTPNPTTPSSTRPKGWSSRNWNAPPNPWTWFGS